MLPAHAGVILASFGIKGMFIHVTRTREGDPCDEGVIYLIDECYPHTRGWSLLLKAEQQHQQMLPAHAGVILKL